MAGTTNTDAFITDINVIPFLDVLLVLLIIFMITAPVMTRSVGVDLPRTKLVKEEKQEKSSKAESAVIGLDKQNRIIFERKKFSFELFATRYAELTKGRTIKKVFIQADKTTSYDDLLKLMVFLKNQGHGNIGLVFDQDD